jgi:glycosyltransferase involved in cell wall biosynthesis
MQNPDRKPVLGMILKGYPRISETFISNEILQLEKQGLSIHLFSMRHPRETFSHQSIKKIRARVDYLPQTILDGLFRFLFHNCLLALKSPRRYTAAAGMAFKRLLRSHKSATIKHLLQAGYLVHRLLPGKGIVHLHAHFAHSPSSAAMFASKLSGLDFSFTAHAKDIYTSNPVQLKEKMAQARFVLTCTEFNRRHLVEISDNDHVPIYRIYHGIDLKLFKDRHGQALPQEPYQILTVARLVPKKGLPTVYRAMQLMREQGVDFRHTLIGDGEDRDRILSMIEEFDLGDVCRWLGTLPHDAVLDHYAQADLFVLGCEQAANGDQDGIPNVFVESMAVGVPVVGTRISAIPELIENEKTGLLVAPGRPSEMARAMLRLLKDIDLRRRILPAAKEKVAREFDHSALAQELFEVYQKGQPRLFARIQGV